MVYDLGVLNKCQAVYGNHQRLYTHIYSFNVLYKSSIVYELLNMLLRIRDEQAV